MHIIKRWKQNNDYQATRAREVFVSSSDISEVGYQMLYLLNGQFMLSLSVVLKNYLCGVVFIFSFPRHMKPAAFPSPQGCSVCLS